MKMGDFAKQTKIILSKLDFIKCYRNIKIDEKVLPFVALSSSADETQRVRLFM